MSIVIICAGIEGNVITRQGRPVSAPDDPAGQYLADYDPNAHDGLGEASWTRLASEAMHFDDFDEAFRFYHTRSTVRPDRPDGYPNKPLTVFSVRFTEARDE